MSRVPIMILATPLVLGACLFAPRIEQDGYTACEESAQCSPGRHCAQGYCSPPPWWDEKYGRRYQVRIENRATAAAPVGATTEFLVGEGGLLETAGFAPALVYVDPSSVEAVPAVALREERGPAYAFIVRLPDVIPLQSVFGDLWLYVSDRVEVATEYSTADEVFEFHEPFAQDVIAAGLFAGEGDVSTGDGRALLRTGSALVSTTGFTSRRVEWAAKLYGGDCRQFRFGLGHGYTAQSMEPPFAMFVAGDTSLVQQQILPAGGQPQVVGDTFFADGLRHHFAISVVGGDAVFQVDHHETGRIAFAQDADEELHFHAVTGDCLLDLYTLRAAPAAPRDPLVTLSSGVTWEP